MYFVCAILFYYKLHNGFSYKTDTRQTQQMKIKCDNKKHFMQFANYINIRKYTNNIKTHIVCTVYFVYFSVVSSYINGVLRLRKME